jgi:hypothetical protein
VQLGDKLELTREVVSTCTVVVMDVIVIIVDIVTVFFSLLLCLSFLFVIVVFCGYRRHACPSS